MHAQAEFGKMEGGISVLYTFYNNTSPIRLIQTLTFMFNKLLPPSQFPFPKYNYIESYGFSNIMRSEILWLWWIQHSIVGWKMEGGQHSNCSIYRIRKKLRMDNEEAESNSSSQWVTTSCSRSSEPVSLIRKNPKKSNYLTWLWFPQSSLRRLEGSLQNIEKKKTQTFRELLASGCDAHSYSGN